jgi:hypothetical protein
MNVSTDDDLLCSRVPQFVVIRAVGVVANVDCGKRSQSELLLVRLVENKSVATKCVKMREIRDGIVPFLVWSFVANDSRELPVEKVDCVEKSLMPQLVGKLHVGK